MASSVTLTVVPDTTPVDILCLSASLMTYKINPASSIVIEQFLQLGLERRLRRYELIRDVMNSWDKDNMNCVLVLPCDVPENDKDLSIDAVPRGDVCPYNFTLQLYHCAKIGKWNKRYITLLENGQMFASKKPGAAPTDKDSSTLCHMSDFDIYTPTENQIRKVLKPPKKYCYAVKSQQKTRVFPTGENFVHFFCAEDPAVAHKFHELVHAWRSWYLVNRRLEVQQKTSRGPAPKIGGGDLPKKHAPTGSIGVEQSGSHRLRVSVDEMPHGVGQFQPLLGMQRFEKQTDEFKKDILPETQPKMHRAKEIPRPNRLSKGPLPTSHARTASVKSQALIQPSEGEFDSKGLLGKDYDARLQQQKRESLQRQVASNSISDGSGPFTEGPSLLNGGASTSTQNATSPPRAEPKPWIPSAVEHTAKLRTSQPPPPRQGTSDGYLQRSNTSRRPPPGLGPLHRPLVNLSSEHIDQPSWRSQRSFGHAVHAPAGVPLVELATGRNQPNRVGPSSTNQSFRPGPPPLLADAFGPPGSRGGPPPASYGGNRNASQSNASMHQGGGSGRRFEYKTPPMPASSSRGMPRDGSGLPSPGREAGDGGYGGSGGRELPPGHGPPLAMRGRSGTMRY
jgi:hypothetical protein